MTDPAREQAIRETATTLRYAILDREVEKSWLYAYRVEIAQSLGDLLDQLASARADGAAEARREPLRLAEKMRQFNDPNLALMCSAADVCHDLDALIAALRPTGTEKE
jgi:hypothetical protein